MATYVQGYKMYDREAKPFVPDYKFLSNVLETRQSRYDQNYQALSEAYGKVVYADLSREDNQNKRDQFAQQIAPKMHQISGYDLSLRQNVDMAKGVFSPFYEDEAILRDLTNTSNYKYGVRYADALKTSLDKEQSDMYWDEGRMDLDIQMQRFLEASPEEALNMTIGQYTPNPNLYEYSLALLTEQGFEVKTDQLDENGRWIITQKNGDLVTDVAYSYLNRALMDDPRVIEGYKVKSRVDAYNFAQAGVDQGQFQSIAEGEEFWARSTIQEITTAQALLLKDDKAEAERIGNQAAGWEEHVSQYNYPEGHSAIKTADNWKARYLAAVQNVEQKRNLVDNGLKGRNSSTNQDLMSRAFMMYMGANIQDDLAAAAKTFSMKDYEMTIEESQYGLELFKDQLDYATRSKLQQEKAELDWMAKQNEMMLQFSLDGRQVNNNATSGYVVTQPGESAGETSFVDIMKMDAKSRETYANTTKTQITDFILNHHQFSQSLLQNGNPNTITIDIGGTPKEFKSMREAKEFLMDDKNASIRDTLFKNARKDLEIPKEGEENRYGWITDPDDAASLARLRRVPATIDKRINNAEQVTQLNAQNLHDNLRILQRLDAAGNNELIEALTEVNLSVSDDFKSLNKRRIEMPFIYTDKENGRVKRVMTKDEFIADHLSRMAYYDPNYNVPFQMKENGLIGSQGEGAYISPLNKKLEPYTDEEELTEELGSIYDQIIYAANATANGKVDSAYGLTGKTSPFKRTSETEYYYNIDPNDMTGASGIQHQGYTNNFNPVRPEGSQADADFRLALNTINTNFSLLGYQFGDIKNKEDVDYLERDTETFDMIRALAQSTDRFFNADRKENGDRIITGLGQRPDFQIQYNPILRAPDDDQENSQSGYVITPSLDWVKDYYEQRGFSGDDLQDKMQTWNDNGGSITIMVDKELDMNPKSLKNVLAGGPLSVYDFEMNTSDSGKSIINDFTESAGTLEIYKDQNGTYMMQETNRKKFDTNTGEYIKLPNTSTRPLRDQNEQFITVNNLDDAIRNLIQQLAMKSQQNLELKKNYQASIAK